MHRRLNWEEHFIWKQSFCYLATWTKAWKIQLLLLSHRNMTQWSYTFSYGEMQNISRQKKNKKNLMTRRVLTKAFIKGRLHFGKSFQFDLRCCGSNSLSHFAWESARWSSWWQPHSHCHSLSWDIKIRTLIKKASNLMACGFTVVLPKFPLIQLLGKHNGI